jgi:hypothetical protein
MDRRWLVMPRNGRWAYLAPALAGFLVSAGVFFEGGTLAVLPHAGMMLLSLVSFLRPTLIAWVCLMLVSLCYLLLLMSGHLHFSLVQWTGVALIGVFPTMALWAVRPRRPATLA